MPEAVFWAGAALLVLGGWLSLAPEAEAIGRTAVGFGVAVWSTWIAVDASVAAVQAAV